MDLPSINAQIASRVAGIQGVGGLPGTAAGTGVDFAKALDTALQTVSQSQNDATSLEQQFQLDNPNVSLEQTMVAINTASLQFSEAVQVRNRLVQAYDQIMNMQV